MYYAELLHARNRLTWFCAVIVVLGLAALAVDLSAGAHAVVQIQAEAGERNVPASLAFQIAGYATCILVTILGATLSADRCHLPYMWTRPVTRTGIAAGYYAIDIIAFAIGYLVVAGTVSMVIANLPVFRLVVDPGVTVSAVRFFGMPLMWFALVEASTSWNSMTQLKGISWGVFWGLLILRSVSPASPFGALIAILNLFNPLAYFTSAQTRLFDITEQGIHTIPFSYDAQTILAYAIFVCGCVAAVTLWKRMEA